MANLISDMNESEMRLRDEIPKQRGNLRFSISRFIVLRCHRLANVMEVFISLLVLLEVIKVFSNKP